MEACLVCLEVKKDLNCAIEVNSTEWKLESVNRLIKKHLWPMDTIQPKAWICSDCWRQLYDFHQFYTRIEEVHSNLAAALIVSDDCKSTVCTDAEQCIVGNDKCKDGKIEIYLETEVLIEQPTITDVNENPLIKQEQIESDLEDIPLRQRRRRFLQTKNAVNKLANNEAAPCKKRKKYKSDLKSKKSINPDNNSSTESLANNSEIVQSSVKQESTVFENTDATELYNIDSESEEDNDETKFSEAGKRKRKNPDEKTCKELDKIIADNFQIFCSMCQISLENFISLRKHFREVHQKRGFVVCCKKKIFTRPVLVDHINFHMDPNYFKCKHCEKVYSERSTLESHSKFHEDSQNGRTHSCEICGKMFVGASQLENHKLTHAPDYEKKFSCSECGKFFTTLYSLNYHIQAIHHNKYVKICDICGKTMRCRNSFKLHMEKHDNTRAAPINCDICGLRLVDSRGLRRHKNSQHPIGGKKDYSCHICSKISPNLKALRSHIRLAHETGYIHKCTMCDKAFKRPEALKEHVATHTGIALYTCPWCPKTFISNGNMHNHRKKSHPKEWEEAKRQKYAFTAKTNSIS